MIEKSKSFEQVKSFLNIWNILRFTLILVCFGWFCSNVFKIVSKYMEFNTIVMVEYLQPNQTDLPGFTICAYSYIYDQDLAQEFWDDWEEYNKTQSNDDKWKIRQTLRDKFLNKTTALEIFDYPSVNYSSIVASCNFFTKSNSNKTDIIPCKLIAPVVESIIQGKKCFTIFSQLNVSNDNYEKNILKYEMNPYVQIVLANHSETTLEDHLNNETTVFTVHSPNIIP